MGRGWLRMDTKKQVVETTCESHEKNSITATAFVDIQG
jgi:hypothetical protein